MKKKKVSWNHQFPLELEREILARLPVKTLLRFRCVCKSWCSLIDSRDFSFMHFNLYNINSVKSQLIVVHKRRIKCIITNRHSDTLRKIGGEFGKVSIPFKCYQIFNGLLLIRHDLKIKLWNPCTRKCLIIPKQPFGDHILNVYKLGFAPSTNDYKVVAFRTTEKAVSVYSLNDHRWQDKTNHDRFLSSYLLYDEEKVVCFGGAMYWVSCNLSGAQVICSFDFDMEEIRILQPPDAVNESMVWFIFRLGESIAVFTMSPNDSCIWIMEKNGEQAEDYHWRLWFLGEPNSDACELFQSVETEILYIQKRNTFVMVQKVQGRVRNGRVMSYSLNSHEIKHLAKSLNCKISFNTYVESLVLHKEIEGQAMTSFP